MRGQGQCCRAMRRGPCCREQGWQSVLSRGQCCRDARRMRWTVLSRWEDSVVAMGEQCCHDARRMRAVLSRWEHSTVDANSVEDSAVVMQGQYCRSQSCSSVFVTM